MVDTWWTLLFENKLHSFFFTTYLPGCWPSGWLEASCTAWALYRPLMSTRDPSDRRMRFGIHWLADVNLETSTWTVAAATLAISCIGFFYCQQFLLMGHRGCSKVDPYPRPVTGRPTRGEMATPDKPGCHGRHSLRTMQASRSAT